MHRQSLALVGLLALGSGCAHIRQDFVPPNGEPLGVFDQTRSYLYNVDVKTGSVRNAAGQEVLATYRRETRVGTERVWFGMQGAGKVDEESFYRIAGDQQAVAQYKDFREGGANQNFIGWIVGPVGLGVMGAGIGMIAFASSTDPGAGGSNPNEAIGSVGYALAIAGGITAIVGFSLVIAGKQKAENPHVRVIGDPERMKVVAQRYNERLFAAQEAENPPAPEPPPPPPPPPRPRRR